MSRDLYNIFLYIIEMLIALAFYSKNYKKKLSSNFRVFSVGSVLFIIGALLFIFFDNAIINLTIFFIINLLFGIICFDISVKSAIIQSIILDAIMYAGEMITIFLSSSVLGFPVNTFRNDLVAYIVLSTMSKIIYLIFSQILTFFIKKNTFSTLKIKYFLPLFVFPILTIITSSVFLFLAYEIELSSIYQMIIFVINVLFILSCIFMFIYYQTLLEKEAKINELESEKQINKLNERYLDILEQQNNEFQMMFHDTKNHYTALSNMESIDEVKSYIDSLYPVLENKSRIRISNNKMLDLIINKYIAICKSADIKFTYEVKTADLGYIDYVELSTILNNALDNAVEAAQYSTEKTVEFSLRHINNMDLLCIINSCDFTPKHISGRLLTTKRQSDTHGFGNKIIQRHTEANNGKYEWFYDENEKKFHLTLLFQKP